MQLLFDGMRQRRFAGTREPGEPDQCALVSVLIFPALSCYGGVVQTVLIDLMQWLPDSESTIKKDFFTQVCLSMIAADPD